MFLWLLLTLVYSEEASNLVFLCASYAFREGPDLVEEYLSAVKQSRSDLKGKVPRPISGKSGQDRTPSP